jgi:hypothetical protein
MKNSRLPSSRVALAALTAFAALALPACGEDARIDSCGPGTMLVGDTCELIDAGTGGTGGAGTDAGGGQGAGGAGGPTDRPDPVEVDGVALTALAITADTPALRPLWPVTVDARFRIVAPPFDSVAGVLLRTQDGAKSCVVGVLDVAHRPPGGAARAAEAQVSMTTTLPAECAALAGLPDVHAAVVFDLFGGSTLHGDAPLADADPASPAPLLGAALPFDRCAPTPAQGATCDATYTIEASPGPSIALTDLTVANPVVVIEYPEGERPAIPADVLRRNLTPPGQDPATLYPADAPAVTVPILPATLPLGVRLSVEGVAQMDAGTLGLAARIRPLPGAVRTAALPAPARGWQPLALIVNTSCPDYSHWVVAYGYGRRPSRVYVAGNGLPLLARKVYCWREFRAHHWRTPGQGLVCYRGKPRKREPVLETQKGIIK